MPFVQSDVIRYLAQYVEEFDIVVPRGESVLHNLKAHRFKIIYVFSNCRVRYEEFAELENFVGFPKSLAIITLSKDGLSTGIEFGIIILSGWV